MLPVAAGPHLRSPRCRSREGGKERGGGDLGGAPRLKGVAPPKKNRLPWKEGQGRHRDIFPLAVRRGWGGRLGTAPGSRYL